MRRDERYSPFQELSPLDEIDRVVSLTPDQREAISALVRERDAAMKSAYAQVVLELQDAAAGADAVTGIYGEFDRRIREELSAPQQALYDAGRREGRIGAPMFVFRYGD